MGGVTGSCAFFSALKTNLHVARGQNGRKKLKGNIITIKKRVGATTAPPMRFKQKQSETRERPTTKQKLMNHKKAGSIRKTASRGKRKQKVAKEIQEKVFNVNLPCQAYMDFKRTTNNYSTSKQKKNREKKVKKGTHKVKGKPKGGKISPTRSRPVRQRWVVGAKPAVNWGEIGNEPSTGLFCFFGRLARSLSTFQPRGQKKLPESRRRCRSAKGAKGGNDWHCCQQKHKKRTTPLGTRGGRWERRGIQKVTKKTHHRHLSKPKGEGQSSENRETFKDIGGGKKKKKSRQIAN